MPEKEPTQYTQEGYEIPVPKRDEILRIFDKAAQPLPDEKPKKSRRRKRSAGK